MNHIVVALAQRRLRFTRPSVPTMLTFVLWVSVVASPPEYHAASAAAAAALNPDGSVDISRMWRELEQHCAQGHCSLAAGSRLSAMANTTDCKGRLLAYEYGLKLLPGRKPQLESFDALQLESTCGVTRPAAASTLAAALQLTIATDSAAYYVDPNTGDDTGLGSTQSPYRTIKRALQETRALAAISSTIVLKPGVHFLNETLALGPTDSGMTLSAAEGSLPGSVVVSGGMLLKPTWKRSHRGASTTSIIWETRVPAALHSGFTSLTTLHPHRRVTRARYPNAKPSEGAELCTDCWTSGVVRWHHNTSCVGRATTVYKDLRECDPDQRGPGPRLTKAGVPCKNDSAMWDTYNTYSNGHGGCCAAWSGDRSPFGPMGHYFCGNSSAGGWVGWNDPRGMPGWSGIKGLLDNSSQVTYAEYNGSQGLSAQLPWGFSYDAERHPLLDSIQQPAGAIMHVWRDQGWHHLRVISTAIEILT
jgi:hypothetical protein